MESMIFPLLSNISIFANANGDPGAAPLVVAVIYFGLILLTIAGLWTAVAKAGYPGWSQIIPIYNVIVLLQVAGRPLWWIILLFVPIVNLIISIIMYVDIAQKFGRGAGTGIGLAFLPFIFWPILGFGSAQYEGGGASTFE